MITHSQRHTGPLRGMLIPVLALSALIACDAKDAAMTPTPEAAMNPGTEDLVEPAGSSRIGTVELEAAEGQDVSGELTFTDVGQEVTLTGTVKGLSPGRHGFHLHERGDCSGEGFKSAGGHWNPENVAHGAWGKGPHHRGDIGNLEVSPEGEARVSFTAKTWDVGTGGDTDVVGRAVIIHADADDFMGDSGHAGERIACGVVRLWQ